MGVLDGKVAVVAGASRGIGKGIALELADAGATVYACGRTLDPRIATRVTERLRRRKVHLGSIAVIYAPLLQSDYLEFLGLRQAWGGLEAWLERPHSRSSPKQFGLQRLEVSGVYGWARHPMLAGGLLYLVTCKNGGSFKSLDETM